MRANKSLIATFLIILLVLMTACEYDVAEPQWDKDYIYPPEPRITSVDPADAAPAGVNYITINGENFAEVLSDNYVYFDSDTAEIVSGSPTSLLVRRPNMSSDSATIKVVSYDAVVVAKHGPYRVDPVMELYGNFNDNVILGAIAIDAAENLYVFQQEDSMVYKVSSDGIKQSPPLGQSPGQVTDAKATSAGTVLMMTGDTAITQMDTETGDVTAWASVSGDVELEYGDFDSNGNFYTGGDESGLYIIRSGETTGELLVGMYADERCEIIDIKVYGDYLYILADFHRSSDMTDGLYRHEILGSDGSLGEPSLLLARTDEIFTDGNPSTIAISSNGIVYFGTDDENNPIKSYNLNDGSLDIFYKDILPSNGAKLEWGEGSYLYMILSGTEWNIVRIDMGAAGATYYGR